MDGNGIAFQKLIGPHLEQHGRKAVKIAVNGRKVFVLQVGLAGIGKQFFRIVQAAAAMRAFGTPKHGVFIKIVCKRRPLRGHVCPGRHADQRFWQRPVFVPQLGSQGQGQIAAGAVADQNNIFRLIAIVQKPVPGIFCVFERRGMYMLRRNAVIDRKNVRTGADFGKLKRCASVCIGKAYDICTAVQL